MLAEALAKLEGFTYAPSETHWWQHGHSSERDFIYVTTQNLSAEQLQALSDDVGPERSLLVCCAAFHGITAAQAAARWPNLTLKKIPKMVLARCEWGHDDYSLNVANLPLAAPSAPSGSSASSAPVADAALAGEDIGSSAGGEQPKFTALLRDGSDVRAVIVKFSERTSTPAGQRWADLLHCEHLAGEVLREHGIAAAESEIVHADGRVFLQSTRFDRTPALGRRGLVSLAALDAAYYGHGRIDWWKFAPQLQRDGWLMADDARSLALRGWFGALIGNNDMHLGNASLVLTNARPLALAPSYDMLPMALRPASTGEVVPRVLDIVPPLPDQRDRWNEAAGLASLFWQRAQADNAMSATMRTIAAGQAHKLKAALARFG